MSTKSSAGCPDERIAVPIASTSLVTPVAVSLCTMRTALIACCVSALKASVTAAAATPRRGSHDSRCTSSPKRSATVAHFPAKKPWSKDKTRSPGDSVFVSAASQAPVADDG